ncbi:MAG: hypothetical protein JSW11_09545 [Candidatus Heimdallarchaeota archaeon]|nr:MAG: hypothetical protein JSW11_09545 [Candidatus Heimdallarchaeota archaeon]
MQKSVMNKIWNIITLEGYLKGLTRTPQRKIFVIKDPQTNPSLVIMDSNEYFDNANGDLFIGRELPRKDTLIELIREHQS